MSVSGEQLKQIINRIENLEEDKTNVSADIKDVYAEAKTNGYDTKILRKIVKLRKMSVADRSEEEALLETYMSALGME